MIAAFAVLTALVLLSLAIDHTRRRVHTRIENFRAIERERSHR